MAVRFDDGSQRAVNLPVRTNETGIAIVWFAVDPPPHQAEIRIGAGRFEMFDAPTISDSLVTQDFELEILTPEHWQVRATLQRELVTEKE